ncbi:hypothetical protein Tco_0508815 [Tanacetum coccineum]
MVFHKIDTKEVSDRFVVPCFVNGLEAYDGEINLRVEENMISNEYAVKLCLEHEIKRGNKIVKKELIVALKGEIYFVKFIINPEEYEVEPGVIFGRSFLRITKEITDFEAGTITIYPNIDPFLEYIEEEEKKAGKEALAIRISPKFALLEEVKPVLETMAYHDKYKKVPHETWKDTVELDGIIVKEEEEAIKKVKSEALKVKDNPIAFIFPIRLEGQVNENALADTRQKLWTNVLCQVGVTTLIAMFLILEIPINYDAPILVGRGFLCTAWWQLSIPRKRLFLNLLDYVIQTIRAARSYVLRTAKA